MPRARSYLFIAALLASLLAHPLAASPQVIVQIEPAGQDFTVSSAEAVEYRGRVYPLVKILFPVDKRECLGYRIAYAGKGSLNLTSLAISSGLAYMRTDAGTCELIIDGTKLRGIAYIDDNPLLLTITNNNITINIILSISKINSKQATSSYNTEPSSGEVHRATRPAMPVEEKTEDSDRGYTGVGLEILAGITLALLLAASVVYEYALGRGIKSPKGRNTRDDLR